jgi:DNA-binding transcriptional regulator YiaG
MSTKSSFREALARAEGVRERSRASSGSPTSKFTLKADKVRQPVEVLRVLKTYGASLRKAHDTLNRLAKGETVAVELQADDPSRAILDFASVGISARRNRLPEIDPKRVRERFGISQAEFAARFCLELDAIQNWEQGRNRPDPAAQLLLKVIEDYPALVEAVVTGTMWSGEPVLFGPQTNKPIPLGASLSFRISDPWVTNKANLRIEDKTPHD